MNIIILIQKNLKEILTNNEKTLQINRTKIARIILARKIQLCSANFTNVLDLERQPSVSITQRRNSHEFD